MIFSKGDFGGTGYRIEDDLLAMNKLSPTLSQPGVASGKRRPPASSSLSAKPLFSRDLPASL
jgi:hypothetical protein